MSKVKNPLIEFLAALQFLTISPPFIRRPFTLNELGGSPAYYPLVGVIIGGLLVLIDYGCSLIFPKSVSSAIVLASWVILSGGLHLDGFLDACDGLFGGHSPDRRMDIMRDERIGAFAFTGGIILFLFKFTTIDSLNFDWRLTALLLAPVFGRWCITYALVSFPYARKQGLGKDIKDFSSWKQLSLATMIALGIAVALAGWNGIFLLGCTALVTWVIVRYTLSLVPGLTGDIYGAINELTETIVLLIAPIAQPHIG